MKHNLILRVIAKYLFPVIALFAFYVQFHGDYGPGGGFQAGVIFASAFILYAIVYGVDTARKVAPMPVVRTLVALGLLPPPMLWIFEWDIVTAGNSVLSYVHYISGDKTQAMVDEGREAVAGARMMKQNALKIKDRIEKNHQDFDMLIAALDYEINLFQIQCRPSYGGWNADASF